MAKKIDVEKFVEWLNEKILEEEDLMNRCISKSDFLDAYAAKEAISIFGFLIDRIESGEEEWLDESES